MEEFMRVYKHKKIFKNDINKFILNKIDEKSIIFF